MKILSGSATSTSGNLYARFRDGLFKVTHLSQATKIADSVIQVGEYYAGYKRRSFISAMQKAIAVKEYNHTHFLSKLKTQRTKMVDCTTWKQYITLMEEIYNYRTPQDKRVRLYI